MTAGLASATLGLAASPAQALTQFAGDYAPGNWTQSIGGGGSIDTSGAPASIVLTSSDDGSSGNVNTDFTIAAPTAGTVSFDCSYVSSDSDGPKLDPFGYLLNGAFIQLTSNGGGLTQSGSASFSVLSRDVFGFRQNTDDSCCGQASTTISNFDGPTAPASVPGPLPILGVWAAFAYSRRLRRRINLAKSPVSTDSVAVEQL